MFVVKALKTVRNNWKKSTLAAVLLSYGINYAKERYEINDMMRAYCEQAKKYGEVILPVGMKPRHVTVILNPASRDGNLYMNIESEYYNGACALCAILKSPKSSVKT